MFTDAEKSKIRVLLGYTDLFRYLHYRLESVFNAVSPEAEVHVREALANIVKVDAYLINSAMPSAGVQRVDEITFFEGRTTKEVREYGRTYINQISIALGVPIYSDYYGTRGYLGDSYTQGGLPGMSGRNAIKLG